MTPSFLRGEFKSSGVVPSFYCFPSYKMLPADMKEDLKNIFSSLFPPIYLPASFGLLRLPGEGAKVLVRERPKFMGSLSRVHLFSTFTTLAHAIHVETQRADNDATA